MLFIYNGLLHENENLRAIIQKRYYEDLAAPDKNIFFYPLKNIKENEVEYIILGAKIIYQNK